MKKFFLAIIICGCASAQTPGYFPVSELSYDIEAKAKTATYPVPDSIVTVMKGDTLRISWQHSVEKATAQDSAKAWDRSGGWTRIVQGIEELNGGVVSHSEEIEFSPGVWCLRIWAYHFAGGGVWNRSPAPSDEIELLVLDKPTSGPDLPRPPMLIEIRVK
jgi:hypothetical protein